MRIMCMIVIHRSEGRMDWTLLRRPKSRTAFAAAVIGGLLAASACSSSSGGSSSAASGGASGASSGTVKVVGIEPLTGPAAFAGIDAQKGYELAIQEINNQGYLGGGKKISV